MGAAELNWLYWLDTCPSTNTWAMEHWENLNHGDVVFTPRQTAGRGQRGRSWYSPVGVLTASVVLDGFPIDQLPAFSLAAGLAVIDAIEALLPELQGKLRLKWPNDVLWQQRKLAGILCEARVRGKIGRIVVGIGLNRWVDFKAAGLGADEIGRAVSLHQVSAMLPDELLLLERLRHFLLQAAELWRVPPDAGKSVGLTARLPALRHRDALLGLSIGLDLGNEQISGVAAGISDQGHLLLQLPNGNVRSFVSGHILW
ncbi:biotin--[acetyl-CoA-carboxylase] ligase (plasmid) [Kovacikia minuta CCNUW1]|uniref:biotin--[acetyl-CoA-carboxylase] ligase n=1 Tax=Kovacikia minuta TaxID=2931930 RepID=UPI001CCEE95D|nr:biotin--[acetyl-CoA-carboxylase] ligase [Kovacikia minuta]UBF30583.1 biotin--[acetyl-CoA-carboxylase] ligase [Kovacikia minuta CCNUW1]